MSAKVVRYRDAWWVRIRFNGKKREKRFGPTSKDKNAALKTAEKINAKMLLGEYDPNRRNQKRLPCTPQLQEWLDAYRPTLKRTTEKLFEGFIRNHLSPHFGDRDLQEIGERDLVEFVAVMQAKGRAPGTIKNNLSFLRQVYNSLIRDEKLIKNPASNLGRIMRSVQNASAKETVVREAWSHKEAARLIAIAREHESGFAPLLELLFATGLRRGEAIGLQWADVDFESRKITVRRSITSQGLSTTKSGRSRRVVMTPALGETLFAQLTRRQRERIERGWPETPIWLFCSETGTAPEPRNVERVWSRVRRRAQKQGIRPLPLHSARHSWATWAIQAGKNIRWVADQLGHADASTTLNHYAHAMREDDEDLAFLDLGVAKRRYASPSSNVERSSDEPEHTTNQNHWGKLERETGFEPATLSLGS